MMKTEADAMLSIPASMVAFPPGSTSNTRCYPPGLGLCLAYYPVEVDVFGLPIILLRSTTISLLEILKSASRFRSRLHVASTWTLSEPAISVAR